MGKETVAIPELLKAFMLTIDATVTLTSSFVSTLPKDGAHQEPKRELDEALRIFRQDAKAYAAAIKDLPSPKAQPATIP